MTVKEWFAIFRVNDDGAWATLTPHMANVNLPISDNIFSAELKWFDNGTFGNTILTNTLLCGNTLEIYADTSDGSTDDMNLLFRGRITRTGEEFTGGFNEKSERFIEAFGYGKQLQSVYRDKKVTSGFAENMLSTIATELSLNGYIAGYEITQLSNIKCRASSENQTYWDLLRNICQDANWDFYVDNGNTLHLFSMGAMTYSTAITPDFMASYEWNCDNMVNSIEVIGASTCHLGSDSEFSDGFENWNGSSTI